MRNVALVSLVSVALLGVASSTAYAQKGVGDSSGVASRAVKPEIISLTGRLIEIRTGLCESTTGKSPIGTHFILETPDGKKLNVHLGPAAAVADMVAKLTVGHEVAVKAFRTEKLKADHFVAQSITEGENRIELRDAELRPVWAQGNLGPRTETDVPRGGCGCCGAGFGRGGGRWRGGR